MRSSVRQSKKTWRDWYCGTYPNELLQKRKEQLPHVSVRKILLCLRGMTLHVRFQPKQKYSQITLEQHSHKKRFYFDVNHSMRYVIQDAAPVQRHWRWSPQGEAHAVERGADSECWKGSHGSSCLLWKGDHCRLQTNGGYPLVGGK
jgi:hypothetical protein